MSLPRERFPEGLSYQQFKAHMTQNRERLEANEQDIRIDEADLAAFRSLPARLNVIAIAEDWCRDAVDNLPVLAKLAADSGKLDLRIFLRDEHQDLMSLYLKDGKYQSLPVFVFFDGDFRELGRFIERPESVTQLRQRKRAEFFAGHPELGQLETPLSEMAAEVRQKVDELNEAIRNETRPRANQEVVQALRTIVEHADVHG